VALAAVEVREVFGAVGFGGTIAARCRWHVDPALVRLAGHGALHLASHVRDGSGQIVISDGPRSRRVAPTEGDCTVVVPLSIPDAPGSYDVELDGVVEGTSWASWLGIEPTVLRVERLHNGGLRWKAEGTPQGRLLRWAASRRGGRFAIPHRLYGTFETERCIEIPWALSRYRGERRVLDVGHVHAEPRYVSAIEGLGIPCLVGIDLAATARAGVRGIVADIRAPALRAGAFDLVLAISVIEHIGRDNTRYVGAQPDHSDDEGDFEAIRAIASLLTLGGRVLLTVPFGRAEHHGWFIQYDARRLDRLICSSGLTVTEAEFYRYRGAWRGPVPARLLADCRYGVRAVAASGVACVSLTRTRVGPSRSRRLIGSGRPRVAGRKAPTRAEPRDGT